GRVSREDANHLGHLEAIQGDPGAELFDERAHAAQFRAHLLNRKGGVAGELGQDERGWIYLSLLPAGRCCGVNAAPRSRGSCEAARPYPWEGRDTRPRVSHSVPSSLVPREGEAPDEP